MFGFVMANPGELTERELACYRGHYCGICRSIGKICGQCARLALNFDMTFLSLLLTSLYETEEKHSVGRCLIHPFHGRMSIASEAVDYAAMMNVALAYYKCRDDWADDRSLPSLAAGWVLGRRLPGIRERYPRQCAAMESRVAELGALEREACSNPDIPANCFGKLMAELFVWREDRWSDTLRNMGMALGRFIYLADASADWEKDKKRGSYNPLLAFSGEPDRQKWEQYLVLELSQCGREFERLPLVEHKSILDKIIYSGVWMSYRKKTEKKREDTHE